MCRENTYVMTLSTVESVFLYGAETWTLTKALEKQLNGCYTRMLRIAFNVSWKEHMTNEKLYEDLPPVTLKIQQRRLRLEHEQEQKILRGQ